MSLAVLKDVTSLLVDITVLLAAIVAVVKLRLFNMLEHRVRSEFTCVHFEAEDGKVVVSADYVLHNSGERPLRLTSVSLRLVPAALDGNVLVPDEGRILARRDLNLAVPNDAGFAVIESGERSIFTLRCQLSELPTVVFVLCSYEWAHKRKPAPYRGIYVRQPSRRSA